MGWESSIRFAASLLAMKQDCAECKGRGLVQITHSGLTGDIECPICDGRGKSDLNVIYEACQDQTPPKSWITKCSDFTEGYLQCRENMLTPSIDANGRKTVWVKVYCE